MSAPQHPGRDLERRYSALDWAAIRQDIKEMWEAGCTIHGIVRTLREDYALSASESAVRWIALAVSPYRPGVGAPGRKRKDCQECPLGGRCKACQREAMREWRARNRERYLELSRESNRRWRERHPKTRRPRLTMQDVFVGKRSA